MAPKQNTTAIKMTDNECISRGAVKLGFTRKSRADINLEKWPMRHALLTRILFL